MRQWLRSHLTYANVMATLAVFLVLGGGTAFGAYVVSNNDQVGPNTIAGHKPFPGQHANIIPGTLNDKDLATSAVTAPKIASNAVTGAKVPDNSLTGNDVLESTLGKVPSATVADSATGASPTGSAGGDLAGAYPNPSLKPPGPATLVLSPCAIGTVWTNLSPNVNNQVGYYRDPLGRVYLQGVAQQCHFPATGEPIFTLPAGFRPANLNHFGTVSVDAFGSLTVDPQGNVTPVAGSFAANGWISLDGISFRCAPSGQDGCP